MQRDATLISAQRADASTADARAAEYDRHLTDLEEYRSGKNKNDVASDGADMAEPQVQNLESGKLLRQRVPTAKELRMGGEFSECVDCDGAMNSSSGSTPFLKGGEIAPSLANQAHFGPPDAAKHGASVEFASSAQHSASASVQSQLAQTDVNREYEAVTSLMEMHGSSAASSSDSMVLLTSGSVSTNAALKPWRLKDQRVSRAGRVDHELIHEAEQVGSKSILVLVSLETGTGPRTDPTRSGRMAMWQCRCRMHRCKMWKKPRIRAHSICGGLLMFRSCLFKRQQRMQMNKSFVFV